MYKYIWLYSLFFDEVESYIEDASDVLIGGVFDFEVELFNLWRKSEGMASHRANCLDIVLFQSMNVMSKMLSTDPELVECLRWLPDDLRLLKEFFGLLSHADYPFCDGIIYSSWV